jgi:hypothetical protein
MESRNCESSLDLVAVSVRIGVAAIGLWVAGLSGFRRGTLAPRLTRQPGVVR